VLESMSRSFARVLHNKHILLGSQPMRNKVSTLLIYATGMPRWERVAVDTVAGALHFSQGLKWLANAIPLRWHENRYIRSFLSDAYSVLSYVHDWQQTFCQTPDLELTTCNLNNLVESGRCLTNIREYELVIILHSAAGDSMKALNRWVRSLQDRKGKLLVFFGNE